MLSEELRAQGDTLTIDKLLAMQRMMEALPPPPVFAAWNEFPKGRAIMFKDGGRQYVGAHPDFWEKLPVDRCTEYPSLSSITIIDLSLTRYADERFKFVLAMRQYLKEAMTLPEQETPDA